MTHARTLPEPNFTEVLCHTGHRTETYLVNSNNKEWMDNEGREKNGMKVQKCFQVRGQRKEYMSHFKYEINLLMDPEVIYWSSPVLCEAQLTGYFEGA